MITGHTEKTPPVPAEDPYPVPVEEPYPVPAEAPYPPPADPANLTPVEQARQMSANAQWPTLAEQLYQVPADAPYPVPADAPYPVPAAQATGEQPAVWAAAPPPSAEAMVEAASATTTGSLPPVVAAPVPVPAPEPVAEAEPAPEAAPWVPEPEAAPYPEPEAAPYPAPEVEAATYSAPEPGAQAWTPPPEIPSTADIGPARVGVFRVLRSEWIKLRTLASTWWVIAITFVVTVGFGALTGFSLGMVFDYPESVAQMQQAGPIVFHATDSATSGVVFAQLVLAILGVMCVTSEYSSGQIHSTLTAVPTRTPVLVAKTVVTGLVSAVCMFAASAAATLVGWPGLEGAREKIEAAGFSLDDDRFTLEGLKVLGGLTLATTLVVVFAIAVGALVRSTAGGIGIVVVILLVCPLLLAVLSYEWAGQISQYLPSNIGTTLYVFPMESVAEYCRALAVMGAWAFVPLLAALVLLHVRDA